MLGQEKRIGILNSHGEVADAILKQTQEDLYWRTKLNAEEVLGIKITAEQWNKFFFNNIAPIQGTANLLESELDEITNSLRVLRRFFND